MVEYGFTGEAIAKTTNGEFVSVHVFDWFRTVYGARCARTDRGTFLIASLQLP